MPCLGYNPSVTSLLAFPGAGTSNKKVLVVGAGCAGLGAAWHLNRVGVDVTLFESNDKLGGHANTINVDGVDVDTGFMVYNEMNYPNLCAFFEELGIEGIPTQMGFSVSMHDKSFEWCSDSLSGLLATPSNAFNPKFYTMFRDVLKFNEAARKLVAMKEDHPEKRITTGEFLKRNNLSDSFRDYYLIPMTAAIWSATTNDILNFPAYTLFTFMNNHLLLQLSDHINWMTPKNRSQEYVEKVAEELGSRAHVKKTIKSFTRVVSPDLHTSTITVVDETGTSHQFDQVIFACHPDQALAIIGSEATASEQKWLSCFKYADNDTYIHCDENLMPKSRAAWTCWNYIGCDNAQAKTDHPVFVTYWLNKLQHLNHSKNILVSLNPSTPPAADKTFSRINYAHPQYSLEAVKAQREVAALQGLNGTFFCGAWMGYGFHEDGFRSGVEVAMALSGVPVPWVATWGQQKMVPAPKMQLQQVTGKTLFQSLTGALLRPATTAFEMLCRQQVLGFLEKAFEKGKITFLLPDKSTVVMTGKKPDEGHHVTLQVFNNWFFVRMAIEADLGFARSYIAGEWEVVNTGPYSSGLTRLLELLIDNMPTGKTKTSGGLDVSDMFSAWIGSTVNALWFHVTMDNTIANSRSNIHAHYDLSNDLFETFLDTEYMMYSSALFKTETVLDARGQAAGLRFTDSLEAAQVRKIDALLQRLEPITSDMQLLDIGSGWGGICIRAAEKYGCRVTGITLSTEQKDLAERKVRDKGLQHLITFELVDYRVFGKSGRKFDRIVSCEMIEAVGHNHLGSFFAAVESLLGLDGIFVMQAINMPDSRYPTYVKTADFIKTIIFPGGCCPSLSALLNAMATNSTLHLENATNTNMHYAETLRRWRQRFNDQLPKIISLGFDDAFIRLWNLYLCYCEAGFEKQVLNLQILTFSRPGNPYMIKAHTVSAEGTIGYA